MYKISYLSSFESPRKPMLGAKLTFVVFQSFSFPDFAPSLSLLFKARRELIPIV
jgi:hypothetical protein